ncbi:transposase [Solirubrobacter ginsenosidimutans]|uniref:Transposase n=1 Tax=Solirubrobacter ginsenosidimutans TaxID=490573 RepID=A0A9X3MNK5_9ACTN|nr:transposase [Solirubrobacter ginsenosidimutans]MDA0159534.1 transposase [Solirubrobacter ginsenosidimutans]
MEIADGIHHVWARGNDRQLIYWDDEDCVLYLKLLAAEVVRKGWRFFAYCLMENHLHLLLQTPEPNLGKGMQRLHGDYALLYNRRHRKVGHVFQGRYGSKPMADDDHFWTTARYILRNPVEAGLCRTAEEWKWSSHRAVLDGTAPPWLDATRLLERFGVTGGDPHTVYRALVDG